MELTITTQSQLCMLLPLIVDLLTQTLYPPVLSQWFLSDVVVRLHAAFHSVFNHVLSPASPIKLSTRATALSMLIPCAITICKHSVETVHFSHITFRVLQYRVSQESSPEIDAIVLKAIELHSRVPPTEADAKEIVRLLGSSPPEELSVSAGSRLILTHKEGNNINNRYSWSPI